MATRLYLRSGATSGAAPYTPATYKGTWDDTSAAVTRGLADIKDFRESDAPINVYKANPTSLNWRVLLYRGVTYPLAAQTINGNIDVCLAVDVNNAAADMHWYIHAYVTQGDSDSVRATLMDNYSEAAGVNEWPATETCKALNAPVAVNVTVEDGDRLVFELGYIARNATTYTGYLGHGFKGTVDQVLPDASVGVTAWTTVAGYIEISDTFEPVGVEIAHLSARTLSAGTPEGQIALLTLRTLSPNVEAEGHIALLTIRTLSRMIRGGSSTKVFMGESVGSGPCAIWME